MSSCTYLWASLTCYVTQCRWNHNCRIRIRMCWNTRGPLWYVPTHVAISMVTGISISAIVHMHGDYAETSPQATQIHHAKTLCSYSSSSLGMPWGEFEGTRIHPWMAIVDCRHALLTREGVGKQPLISSFRTTIIIAENEPLCPTNVDSVSQYSQNYESVSQGQCTVLLLFSLFDY